MSLSKLTKYCACHEKWISWLILVTHDTLFTTRGVTNVIVQTHQILPLPRKMTVQSLKEICCKRMKRHFQCAADPRMIREWSEHDPTMKPSVRNPPRNRGYFSRPPRAFCSEKYNVSRSGYHSKIHRILRLPRKVTLELHQILRLPRKVTLIIDPLHTWNVIYNARSNKCHCPNSQNILRLPRKMTVQSLKEICWKRMKRHFQCAADPRMIRAWSDHETVSPQPASQPRLLFTPTTSILYCKIQRFALRLSFQNSPNTAPATKSDTWTSPNTAPGTNSDTWTSPNRAST